MKRSIIIRYISAIAIICVYNAVNAEELFSLKNKSGQPIEIELLQGLDSLTGRKKIANGTEFTWDVDIKKINTLYIYYKPADGIPEKWIATFSTKKPIFVVFEGSKKMRPQR